ncbi:hypothetical protein BDV93DRAFT_510644 [Ceratobasidium sp. AG-I]|nr:hypothetical protein BDV93DRAFT_510644 [Ceratobasidium sp. AG-I]
MAVARGTDRAPLLPALATSSTRACTITNTRNQPKDSQIPKATIQPSKPNTRSTAKGKNKQRKKCERAQDNDENVNMELDETVCRHLVEVGAIPRQTPKPAPFEQQEEPRAKRPTVRPKMVPLPFPKSTKLVASDPIAPPVAGPSRASAPAIPINSSDAIDSVANEVVAWLSHFRYPFALTFSVLAGILPLASFLLLTTGHGRQLHTAAQQKTPKFQSALERSGAMERMEPPPAIRNAQEHMITQENPCWAHNTEQEAIDERRVKVSPMIRRMKVGERWVLASGTRM